MVKLDIVGIEVEKVAGWAVFGPFLRRVRYRGNRCPVGAGIGIGNRLRKPPVQSLTNRSATDTNNDQIRPQRERETFDRVQCLCCDRQRCNAITRNYGYFPNAIQRFEFDIDACCDRTTTHSCFA